MVVLFIYHRGEACLLRGSLSPKKIYFLRGGGMGVHRLLPIQRKENRLKKSI